MALRFFRDSAETYEGNYQAGYEKGWYTAVVMVKAVQGRQQVFVDKSGDYLYRRELMEDFLRMMIFRIVYDELGLRKYDEELESLGVAAKGCN